MTDTKTQGPVMWITGASSGIGAALALHAARDGWNVAASARSEERLENLRAQNPDRIRVFPMDVTDRKAVAEAVSRIETEVGPIDTAVLNAGTHQDMPVDAFDAARIEELFQVNVIGAVNCAEPLLKRFRERRGGHIAFMASVAGYRGLPRAAGYCGSKAAVIAIAESLKTELDGYGIKTQVICPGFVETPLTDRNPFPMPYILPVDVAARRIYDGLREDRFEIAFPRRFVYQLKLLRHLPNCAYNVLVRRATGV